MNSNAKYSAWLESKLLQYYGIGIAELREYATSLGVDLTIQEDCIYISRPGYRKGIQPNIPASDMEWRMNFLHYRIEARADLLWEKNDPKPSLNSTAS